MYSGLLNKLILLVIRKYLLDPVTPLCHLHFLQGIAHFHFKAFFCLGASTISDNPIGKFFDATWLYVHHIAFDLMLIDYQPRLLKLLALD